MRSLPTLATVLAALVGLAGCGSDSGGGGGAAGCPNDLPKNCPMPTPSYARDVVPIMKTHCLACHDHGGTAEGTPLATYEDVFARRSAVLNQVYACEMPTPEQTPLDASERARLFGWLVCMAPEN